MYYVVFHFTHLHVSVPLDHLQSAFCFFSFSSSSSSMALQLWYSLGLLKNILPFKTVLDFLYTFYNFQLFQVLPDIVFPPGLGSSCWSSCELVKAIGASSSHLQQFTFQSDIAWSNTKFSPCNLMVRREASVHKWLNVCFKVA